MSQFQEFLQARLIPLRLVLHNYRELIRFEFFYRILSLTVFFPLLIYTERLLLVLSSSSSITAYNIWELIQNPFTYVILALIGILVCVFVQLEQFGIISILHAAHEQKRISASQAFSNAVDFMVNFFHPKNIFLIFYFLIIFPFSEILDTSSITRFIRMPGFIVEHLQKYPILGVLYTLFGLGMLYLGFRLVYSLIIMCIEECDFTSAAKKSFRYTRGERAKQLIIAILKRSFYLILSFAFIFLVLALLSVAVLKWLEPGFDLQRLMDIRYPYLLVLITFMLYSWFASPLMRAVIMTYYYRFMQEDAEVIPPYEENQNLLSHWPVKTFCILIIVICSYFSIPERYQQFKWILRGNSENTLIMAHRGYSEKAPENTLPAFEEAYKAGATAIELDVQMLKDGTIICMHDDSLNRTARLNKNVWEVTYDEIKDLDNGSFFSKEYADVRIPTLQEALQYCNNKLYVNIEIKRTGHDEGIEDEVVRIIREEDFQNQCDITSQDYDTLLAIREKYPDVLLAYTSVIGIGDLPSLSAADIISIQETFASYPNVEALHRAGKKVFVWTVNDESEMERLIALNVDAILTNDPETGVRILKSHTGIIDFYKRLEQILYYLN